MADDRCHAMTCLLHLPFLLFFAARAYGDGNPLAASWLHNSDTAPPDTGLHRDEVSFYHIWGRCTVHLLPCRAGKLLSWELSFLVRSGTQCIVAIQSLP
jgi:hypothetical protein